MSELLPCPFCGGDAEFERMGDRRQSCIVACTDCGCRHESSDEHENNGASWNDRHAPEGWRVVPVELTPSMRRAGQHAKEHDCYIDGIYADIIAAAPKP